MDMERETDPIYFAFHSHFDFLRLFSSLPLLVLYYSAFSVLLNVKWKEGKLKAWSERDFSRLVSYTSFTSSSSLLNNSLEVSVWTMERKRNGRTTHPSNNCVGHSFWTVFPSFSFSSSFCPQLFARSFSFPVHLFSFREWKEGLRKSYSFYFPSLLSVFSFNFQPENWKIIKKRSKMKGTGNEWRCNEKMNNLQLPFPFIYFLSFIFLPLKMDRKSSFQIPICASFFSLCIYKYTFYRPFNHSHKYIKWCAPSSWQSKCWQQNLD